MDGMLVIFDGSEQHYYESGATLSVVRGKNWYPIVVGTSSPSF